MDKIKEKPHTVASVREKIKAAPKELVHRGLEDGSDRLRTQLRDAAQQGRRDDYGGVLDLVCLLYTSDAADE